MKKISFGICAALLFLLPLNCVAVDEPKGSSEDFFEVQDNSDFMTPAEEEASLRARLAGISAKIVGLQEELFELKGRAQEADHRFDKKVDDRVAVGTKSIMQQIASFQGAVSALKKETLVIQESVSENSKRILRLEKYTGFEPSQVEAKPTEKDPSSQKELTEDEFYLSAKSLLDAGDLKASKESFDRFLVKFPKSERADNAQFWIGEIYYREQWYEKAILEYQKVIENYKAGNKVPAAFLKQGLAFEKLGESANARLRFKELVKKFPGSSEAALAKKKLK